MRHAIPGKTGITTAFLYGAREGNDGVRHKVRLSLGCALPANYTILARFAFFGVKQLVQTTTQ